jgi:hypothetical protein
MTDRNPHTGAKLQSKETTDMYRSNYDAIFGKPKPCRVALEYGACCNKPDCIHRTSNDNNPS